MTLTAIDAKPCPSCGAADSWFCRRCYHCGVAWADMHRQGHATPDCICTVPLDKLPLEVACAPRAGATVQRSNHPVIGLLNGVPTTWAIFTNDAARHAWKTLHRSDFGYWLEWRDANGAGLQATWDAWQVGRALVRFAVSTGYVR